MYIVKIICYFYLVWVFFIYFSQKFWKISSACYNLPNKNQPHFFHCILKCYRLVYLYLYSKMQLFVYFSSKGKLWLELLVLFLKFCWYSQLVFFHKETYNEERMIDGWIITEIWYFSFLVLNWINYAHIIWNLIAQKHNWCTIHEIIAQQRHKICNLI